MLIKRPFSQSVAKRILFSFFLCSFILTAISIAVILYSQYTKEKAEVISDTHSLINSRLEFISEVLWNMDESLAELSIKSLADNPNITYIAIIDENEKTFTKAGLENISFTEAKTYPLVHKGLFDNDHIKLGNLVVNIATNSAQQHAKDNFINIMLVQAFKSIVTSAIFLFLIYNILIKHLYTITYGIVTDASEKANLNDFISLKRTYRNDELQLLSDTLNTNQLAMNKQLRKLEKEKKKLTTEIGSRKAAEVKAKSSYEELLNVFNSLTAAVYLCRDDGEVLFMNYKGSKFLGRHDFALIHTDQKQYLEEIISFKKSNDMNSDFVDIKNLSNNKEYITNKYAYLVPNDGEEEVLTPVELTFIPTKFGENTEESKFILVVKDKTNEVKIQEMNHIISHDFLTKIYNRMYLSKRVEEVLESGRGVYSLAIIDLDKFKAVNDTCGHRAGDELLKLVATTIPKSLDEHDLFARIGGDEFAVLFNSDTKASKKKSVKIIADLEGLDFTFDDQILPISCSIGITDLSHDDKSIESVMTRADEACYQVKRNGKGHVEIFKSNVTNLQPLLLVNK